jgi:hypothetical protein
MNLEERQRWLACIDEKRKPVAVEKLKAEIIRQFKERKSNVSQQSGMDSTEPFDRPADIKKRSRKDKPVQDKAHSKNLDMP